MYNEFNGTDEKEKEQSGEDSFADLFEESLKGLKEGEVVKGTIVDLNQDYVVVDIGYKSEGTIEVSEFLDEDGNVEVKPGDEVQVFIVKREDKEGKPVLSRQRALAMKIWIDVEEASKSGATIRGRITDVIKGGYFVDIKGVKAFLPGSQVDLRPVRDMASLVGKVFDFRVLSVDRGKNNIVVSRRVILEEEREGKKKEALENIEEGVSVKGIVKNITNYGAFLDVGGIDGLLHITDISWGRVNHPSEVLNVGDEVDVKVLKFDREKVRLTLGLKQTMPDPWTAAVEKYPIGSKVNGKVVSLMDYGAFVQLEDGFEGLVHVSEMSWTKKIKHPSQIVKVGDEVEVVVLDIDTESRRVSLGLKQIEPNPWDIIESNYPVGSKVSGTVKSVTDFGIFIGFEEGIDGMVHVSDLSWTKKVKDPSELFKEGDDVEAVVLAIDRENEKFSLGVKQLEENPWDSARKNFKKGTVVSGKVTSITDFGIFLEIAEGVEGLIRQSDFGSKGDGNPKEIFNIGDEVHAEVVRVNKQERRIALSIKAYEMSQEKKTIKEYVKNQGDQNATFGDLLKDKLKGDGKEED
ncbi:MAG: 30S ribosomal protein S1 [Deltaproteobacteria bacterium]|nr:30S ribosomal protein S1 [Deltaproteobacteria bacterium]